MKKTIGTLFGTALLLSGAILLAAQDSSDYKIAPLDILVIDVVGEKDLPREFRVSGNGNINFPYLQSVEVAGKTTSEIKQELEELLDRDYIVNPQVLVDVKQYRVREILVTGQVNKPGSVALGGEEKLTILDAIGRAGSLTARGNPNKIKFTRAGKIDKTFTLDDLKKEKEEEKIYCQPGDVIEVADKLF